MDIPIILVHGAWHGSWAWVETANLLRKRGITVYTPDLPGHYSNKRNLKDITLKEYVTSIEDLIRSTESKVMLVGHSMAGIVISQVAENMPENISKLVYLSAFVPDNNGSLSDEGEKEIKSSVFPEVRIDEEGRTISIKHSSIVKDLFYGLCPEDICQDAISKLQDQPLMPFVDKVKLTDGRFGPVKKSYIACIRDNAISIEDQERMYSKIKCKVYALDTDHSPFFSDTHNLVMCLTDILNYDHN